MFILIKNKKKKNKIKRSPHHLHSIHSINSAIVEGPFSMDNLGLFVSCFLKLFFVLKNKENKEKSVWFLFYFFSGKHRKH